MNTRTRRSVTRMEECMRSKLPLPLAAPCEAEWETMREVPDSADRFCETCEKTVHNLSGRTREEIRALLKSTPNLCVRYLYEPHRGLVRDGATRTLTRFAAAAALVTAPTLLQACGGLGPIPRDEPAYHPEYLQSPAERSTEPDAGADAGTNAETNLGTTAAALAADER